ncbi:phosphoglycolate phosphatase [Hahella sp. CCB-MM4]|uniref:HAD family hydrolase n=1 Tax=Hahella sp. (strain CCB-MM4) TaxID=1926491 RepID=UPI000B9B9E42|nr:HAD-IA family hydrolase [Hahella sp. CCB-MM4]OZG71041.1 phosphoglycolate phosphatase [Hahella sp. CCB-MM4]
MIPTGSPPKGILFDLDGTLIDTAPDFHRVLNSHRRRHGLDDLPYPLVRQAVSEGARALVKLGFDITEEHPEFEPLRQEFLQLYLDNICVDSCLFPGFSPLLDQLEKMGIAWGIVTNKPRLYSEALLAALGLSSVAVLVCPDDVAKTKPDPEPLLKAASQLGLPASSFWYIGDHYRDILAGRNAGMKTVAAAYGYIPQNDAIENWEADYIIHQAQDLASLLMA